MSKSKIVLTLIMIFVLSFASEVVTKAQSNKIINSEAIKLNNRAVELYGKSFMHREYLQEAIKLLDSAISIQPRYIIAYENLAQYSAENKEYKKAMEALDTLEKLRPNHPEFLIEKGKLYAVKGQVKQSRVNYLKADKILKEKYEQEHGINELKNIAYIKLLLYNIDSSFAFIDREKYRFQNNVRQRQELFYFKKNILPAAANTLKSNNITP